MKALIALFWATALAASASAQSPSPTPDDAPPVSLRPFFVYVGEGFSAHQTFDAVFGQSFGSLWGGGLEVVFRKGVFVDLTASRFKRTGQRAYFQDGQGYGLGIPLTVTLTPFEVTGGLRFPLAPRLISYVGGGFGSYRYQETSDFDDGPFDTRHAGYLLVGGAEVRISRWFSVSGDVQATRVSGILGTGGVSKEADEHDLGGVQLRVRAIVGR